MKDTINAIVIVLLAAVLFLVLAGLVLFLVCGIIPVGEFFIRTWEHWLGGGQ